MEIVLFDVQGNQDLIVKPNNSHVNIGISSLPRGIYIAIITSNGKVSSDKIIVD